MYKREPLFSVFLVIFLFETSIRLSETLMGAELAKIIALLQLKNKSKINYFIKKLLIA